MSIGIVEGFTTIAHHTRPRKEPASDLEINLILEYVRQIGSLGAE